MQFMHAYEVVGEVILRRSGNGAIPVRCLVIRTRATFEEGGYVQIRTLASGLANDTRMPVWFSDWTDADNCTDQFGESGRPVDVAVPLETIERQRDSGKAPQAVYAGEWCNPFNGEYAAVLVEGKWIEPELVAKRNHMP